MFGIVGSRIVAMEMVVNKAIFREQRECQCKEKRKKMLVKCRVDFDFKHSR